MDDERPRARRVTLREERPPPISRNGGEDRVAGESGIPGEVDSCVEVMIQAAREQTDVEMRRLESGAAVGLRRRPDGVEDTRAVRAGRQPPEPAVRVQDFDERVRHWLA